MDTTTTFIMEQYSVGISTCTLMNPLGIHTNIAALSTTMN